jgi:putative acetyltransferase
MSAVHRLATLDDAKRLLEIRRKSILELTAPAMSAVEAQLWATALTLTSMKHKFRELEIWAAELDGTVAGWGAIRGDYLEGLYTAPEFTGRGVGTGLLERLEGLIRERSIQAVRAEASSNARAFYLRRGYRATGPQTPDRAWPIPKDLQ